MDNECLVCMDSKEVNQIRCLATKLIHPGYYACVTCQREWFIRERRCL